MGQPLDSEIRDEKTGESSLTGEQEPAWGPFSDQCSNEIWRVFASQMMENYKQLADVDMLEPNPANSIEAMLNMRLSPFWLDSEQKEMDRVQQRFMTWCLRSADPSEEFSPVLGHSTSSSAVGSKGRCLGPEHLKAAERRRCCSFYTAATRMGCHTLAATVTWAPGRSAGTN
eukprot:2995987-Rhodomonas_salina.1